MLVSGKADDAYRLTVDSLRGPAPPDPGMPAATKTPLEAFKENPVIKELAAAGDDSKIRFDSTISYEKQSAQNVRLKQKFSITPETAADSTSKSGPIELILTVSRARVPGDVNSRWLVNTYADAGASENFPVSK
jgi:hypothetical protein